VSTNKLASWSEENGMVVNLAKCGVLGTKPSDPPLMFPGLGPLPVVDSYKYLGFPFESTGVNWAAHLESVTAKAKSTLAMCR
ncbi:hypothetical protein BGX28_002256, partial [Mortierella sp. GBA30]